MVLKGASERDSRDQLPIQLSMQPHIVEKNKNNKPK